MPHGSDDLTTPAGSDPAAGQGSSAHPQRIGPYRILQVLGEGGMGVVYDAEQTEPIRRRVALKVVKLGMDTREVVARFDAERQALAVMDHPNIARVYDAGATETGRPYFVMERVAGVPITRFCDERKLDPRARLALFGVVCQAVQHAHQKSVIHRDLKPSNVLVAYSDGTAVPKIIDFGIAKAVMTPATSAISTLRSDVWRAAPPLDADLPSGRFLFRPLPGFMLSKGLFRRVTRRQPFDPRPRSRVWRYLEPRSAGMFVDGLRGKGQVSGYAVQSNYQLARA